MVSFLSRVCTSIEFSERYSKRSVVRLGHSVYSNLRHQLPRFGLRESKATDDGNREGKGSRSEARHSKRCVPYSYKSRNIWMWDSRGYIYNLYPFFMKNIRYKMLSSRDRCWISTYKVIIIVNPRQNFQIYRPNVSIA